MDEVTRASVRQGLTLFLKFYVQVSFTVYYDTKSVFMRNRQF